MNVLEEVINTLFYIAEADGHISDNELIMIQDIARIFGLNQTQINGIKESRKSSDKLNPYIVLESKPKMRAVNSAWDQIQKLKN